MWLAEVYIGKKAHYSFIMLANNSRDVRARLKKNARAVIKEVTETHWDTNYRTLEERTRKMRDVLAAIKNNKIKITELGSCRVYPVSYFDDTRSVC
jgi:predicted transcriptional regulator YheO